MYRDNHTGKSQGASVVVQLFALCFLALSLGAPAQAGSQGSPNDILIIANNSVKADTISQGELRALFLKKKANVKGSKVVPINAKRKSTIRMAFQKRILRMTPDEESAYWESMKIRKGVTPTIEFRDTFKAVFSVRGGIGYCYRSQYKKGLVKILREL